MNNDLISRSALMDDIQASVDYGGTSGMVAGALKRYVKRVPAVDALPVDIVAQMLCDAIGDPCACNVNGNDEWLPNYKRPNHRSRACTAWTVDFRSP